MSWMTPLALVVALQAPQAPSSDSHAVITLRTGGVIEGDVVHETADYVELRLDHGAVVGFDRSRIESLERRSVPEGSTVATAAEAVLADKDQWFVLHDAEGRVVGRLHSTVQNGEDGEIRVGEEWEFRRKGQRTEITVLEWVDPELTPIRAFYRERTRRPVDQRVMRERVVRATVVDGELVVDKQAHKEQQRSRYTLTDGVRFPLSTAERHRQDVSWSGEAIHSVFDTRTEQFERRTFVSRHRQVDWQGERRYVRELSSNNRTSRNTEWVEASAGTVRREINGSSLVAMPVEGVMTERYLMSTEPVFEPAYVQDEITGLTVWLPDPSWHVADREVGRIEVDDPVRNATISALTLDHVDPDVLLPSAADQLERWLRLVRDNIEMTGRESVRVRGRPALRLDARYMTGSAGARRQHRCAIYLVALDGAYRALCFDAPSQQWETLQPDVRRVLAAVEVMPVEAEGSLAGRD